MDIDKSICEFKTISKFNCEWFEMPETNFNQLNSPVRQGQIMSCFLVNMLLGNTL